MSLRYTFRSETTVHKFIFGKRSVTVKELKQHIINNHKGLKYVSIINILTEQELKDSVLLFRGSNVQVKRFRHHPIATKTSKKPKNKLVQRLPKRFLAQLAKPILKDETHLKEQCRDDVTLNARGDAQLTIFK